MMKIGSTIITGGNNEQELLDGLEEILGGYSRKATVTELTGGTKDEKTEEQNMSLVGGKMGSAMCVGKRHAANGEPCQDRSISVIIDNLIVLAVSDGVGSHPRSELGAEFAMRYVTENARELYAKFMGIQQIKNRLSLMDANEEDIADSDNEQQELIFSFFSGFSKSAVTHARCLGVELNDLSCTLSFAIVGPEYTIAASLGDSPIFIRSKRHPDRVVRITGNDGNHSNYTYDATYLPTVRMAVGRYLMTNYLEEILITSDGAEGLGVNVDDDKPIFSDWFYQVLRGDNTTVELAVALTEHTNDDCSFAFYSQMCDSNETSET